MGGKYKTKPTKGKIKCITLLLLSSFYLLLLPIFYETKSVLLYFSFREEREKRTKVRKNKMSNFMLNDWSDIILVCFSGSLCGDVKFGHFSMAVLRLV